MTLIDTTNLIKIGDMVSGGGLPAAVNAGDGGATGYKMGTTGWAGVVLASSTAISHVDVTSASNGFDASGSQTQITLKLYGRQGTAPAHGTNGVLLGTVGPFTDINSTTTRTIQSNDTTTPWDYLWVTGNTGVWTVFESIKFYSVEPPPPVEEPEPIPAERYTLKTVCNTPHDLNWDLTYIPDFTQEVCILTPAVAIFSLRADIIHRGASTGFNGPISLGALIQFKYSDEYEELDSQPWIHPANTVSGRNLCELNPQHYEAHHVTGAMELLPGYYRFGVFMNSKSTGVPEGTNGLAGILVEYGTGLNMFLTHIDHGAILEDLS